MPRPGGGGAPLSSASGRSKREGSDLRFANVRASCLVPGAGGFGNQFTRIHEVLWIDRLLDRAHHVERRAVLGFQILQLADADAVLAAACAAKSQRAFDETFAQPRNGG